MLMDPLVALVFLYTLFLGHGLVHAAETLFGRTDRRAYQQHCTLAEWQCAMRSDWQSGESVL